MVITRDADVYHLGICRVYLVDSNMNVFDCCMCKLLFIFVENVYEFEANFNQDSFMVGSFYFIWILLNVERRSFWNCNSGFQFKLSAYETSWVHKIV
jgi:hypothetical protein